MRFRKKPDEIEAVQWSGSNWHSMLDFAGKDHVSTDGARLFLKNLPNQVTPAIEVPAGCWVVRWAEDGPHMSMGEYWMANDTAIQRDWEEAPDDSA